MLARNIYARRVKPSMSETLLDLGKIDGRFPVLRVAVLKYIWYSNKSVSYETIFEGVRWKKSGNVRSS